VVDEMSETFVSVAPEDADERYQDITGEAWLGQSSTEAGDALM
jgi:hypothetical protein